MMDIKSFTNLGGPGGWAEVIIVQKNEKITRTVPILKSNSTQFSFNFFSAMDIKIYLKGRGPGGRVDFFFTYYYNISSM